MRLSVLALMVLVACNKSGEIAPAAAPAAAESSAQPQLPVPAVPQSSKWALDPENSSVQFAVKHVLTTVRGMFKLPAGSVTVDEASKTLTHVDAAIEVSTISTGVEERDAHLKGSDFFDAAKFPQLTFVSTGSGKSSVTGNLTMHGVTKPVTLTVTLSPPFNHAGGIRRGVEATTSVNRRDFGLLWDFPGEGSGVVVGDVIKVTIDAELVLQP